MLVALPMILALVAAELVVRRILPPLNRHYVYPPNTTRVSFPDPKIVHGLSPSVRFTINGEGIRGGPFAANQYRILAIGGSTTELLYNDDSVAWTAQLEKRLGRLRDGRAVWIGNVARSGHDTPSHELQFHYLTQEYPEIRAVLMLIGINDLGAALRHSAPSLDPMARAFEIFPGSNADLPWWKRLGLYRLASRVKNRIAAMRDASGSPAQDVKVEWLARMRPYRAEGEHIDSMPDMRVELAQYTERLRRMALEAKRRGITLVYLTQPSLLRADNTPYEQSLYWTGWATRASEDKKVRASAYYTSRVMFEGLRHFNRATLAVCAEGVARCVDLASAVPRDTSMFWDDVHFTDAGSRNVAAVLADSLARILP